MANFHRVVVEQVAPLLAADNAMLLDCRRLADYKQGHIDNALHAHDALVESLIRSGDKQRNLVIYCYHGHSSEHLAELLANFGFTAAYSVEGGYESYEKWQAYQQQS